MTKAEEFLTEFRAHRNVLKITTEKYNQLKRDICKSYGREYDAFMTDGDIMEMLLSDEPKESA